VTPPQTLLVQAAARNNAEWCAAMGRAHGVAGDFGAQAWAARARTPRHYPDAVTLVPDADRAALLARIDTAAAGASVKDSFADLDLAEAGFRVLFEAQWIHRPASAPTPSSGRAWTVVDTPDALRAWALASDDADGTAELFRPALLHDPATVVLAGRSGDGRLVAGAVATRSDQVVGISHLLALDADLDAAWSVVLEAVTELFPALPVVGYDRGDDLEVAVHHGLRPVGPLRVWLHDR
jgi:hypothetical protein